MPANEPTSEQVSCWEAEQRDIATTICLTEEDPDLLSHVKYIAGVDLSFLSKERFHADQRDFDYAAAGVVVVKYPSMEVVCFLHEVLPLPIPYISGLLAVREAPPLLRLFERLKVEHPEFYPDLLMVDGNGIWHPRMCGLATTLSHTLSIPTIGVSKKLMELPSFTKDMLKEETMPHLQTRGDWAVIKPRDMIPGLPDDRQPVAAAVLTGESHKPIFVSQGGHISLETAVKVVSAVSHVRIPQPIRAADHATRDLIAEYYESHQSPVNE
ncbi:endonuclease V [Kipferlia bialata]|uniref:Endonuclease V n=1 Tax=Kipferlia bialata TaxID=797122 RepID=A0A9K3D356_9EUKA|nr:endonuclease V [Kipferlia bialata]|eukprot:g10058.t1